MSTPIPDKIELVMHRLESIDAFERGGVQLGVHTPTLSATFLGVHAVWGAAAGTLVEVPAEGGFLVVHLPPNTAWRIPREATETETKEIPR